MDCSAAAGRRVRRSHPDPGRDPAHDGDGPAYDEDRPMDLHPPPVPYPLAPPPRGSSPEADFFHRNVRRLEAANSVVPQGTGAVFEVHPVHAGRFEAAVPAGAVRLRVALLYRQWGEAPQRLLP